jgi:hypothetical protein
MTDVMFELPDVEPKGKYVVSEAVVQGTAKLFEKPAATDKMSA